MAGAFIAYYAVIGGLPLWLALLIAMISCGCVSVLLDRLGFQLLRKYSHADAEFGATVISIGAGQVLTSLAQKAPDTKVHSFPSGTFPVEFFRGMGLRFSLLQITIATLVVILLLLLANFLQKISFGRQVRAVAINRRASALLGINSRSVFSITFSSSGPWRPVRACPRAASTPWPSSAWAHWRPFRRLAKYVCLQRRAQPIWFWVYGDHSAQCRPGPQDPRAWPQGLV